MRSLSARLCLVILSKSRFCSFCSFMRPVSFIQLVHVLAVQLQTKKKDLFISSAAKSCRHILDKCLSFLSILETIFPMKTRERSSLLKVDEWWRRFQVEGISTLEHAQSACPPRDRDASTATKKEEVLWARPSLSHGNSLYNSSTSYNWQPIKNHPTVGLGKFYTTFWTMILEVRVMIAGHKVGTYFFLTDR